MGDTNAVNVPIDEKKKQYDISLKLQLYGIYAAFGNGKLPSNDQIDVVFNSLLGWDALRSPSNKLSEEGQELVQDIREVIEEAKYLFLCKNQGNLLQEFIWGTRRISTDTNAPDVSAEKDTHTAQQREKALNGLRTLGTLIISNGQFRKLLKDAIILIRSIIGDAAANAARRISPGEDNLAQIDKPAEDNVWHETPDLSKEGLRVKVMNAYDKTINTNKPTGDQNVQDVVGDEIQAVDEQEYGKVPAIDAQANIKEIAQNKKVQALNYLSKKVPKELLEQTFWRLKKMVIEIQGHEDYEDAIEALLDLAATYVGHSRGVSKKGRETMKGLFRENEETLMRFKKLIERFANCTSTEDFLDSINNIYRDADEDSELKNWFKNLNIFIRKCLKEQGFIMQDEATDEWDQLYTQGRFLLRERYRDHTDRVINEVKFLGDQFDHDPQNKRFGDAVQKLFLDLSQDKNGKPAFKKHLLDDIVKIVLPAMFERIRYVPIPRIEVSDPHVDAIIENLVIESDNLMPNIFEFTSDNYFQFARKEVSHMRSNKVMVGVSGIQLDVKDVNFYVNKKRGFPSLSDIGIMDIFLGGQGLSFRLALSMANVNDRANFFKIDDVDVDMEHFNIKLKKSKHKILFTFFKPLLLKAIRPALQKAVEKQIKETFIKLDAMAYAINQDVQRAKKAAIDKPDEAHGILQPYIRAYQKMLTANKENLERPQKDVRVNMTVTQRYSLFKDIVLPGAISTKVKEFRELADSGDKWESSVFSVGGGAESEDIPRIEPITRKPHTTVKGEVRKENQVYGENKKSGEGVNDISHQVDQTFVKANGDAIVA